MTRTCEASPDRGAAPAGQVARAALAGWFTARIAARAGLLWTGASDAFTAEHASRYPKASALAAN